MDEKDSRGFFHVTDDIYKIEDRYNKIVSKVKADFSDAGTLPKAAGRQYPCSGHELPGSRIRVLTCHGFMGKVDCRYLRQRSSSTW